MPGARLTTKQYSTLSARKPTSTAVSASPTGASTTATTSRKRSGVTPASGSGSDLEETLAMYMRAVGIPEPLREYRFDPKRRWRADFAWPELMLLVEVEGGQWTNGRHTRGAGFEADCEKYNEAALFGWRVLRVTSTHIKTGEALAWIVRALV